MLIWFPFLLLLVWFTFDLTQVRLNFMYFVTKRFYTNCLTSCQRTYGLGSYKIKKDLENFKNPSPFLEIKLWEKWQKLRRSRYPTQSYLISLLQELIKWRLALSSPGEKCSKEKNLEQRITRTAVFAVALNYCRLNVKKDLCK